MLSPTPPRWWVPGVRPLGPDAAHALRAQSVTPRAVLRRRVRPLPGFVNIQVGAWWSSGGWRAQAEWREV